MLLELFSSNNSFFHHKPPYNTEPTERRTTPIRNESTSISRPLASNSPQHGAAELGAELVLGNKLVLWLEAFGRSCLQIDRILIDLRSSH